MSKISEQFEVVADLDALKASVNELARITQRQGEEVQIYIPLARRWRVSESPFNPPPPSPQKQVTWQLRRETCEGMDLFGTVKARQLLDGETVRVTVELHKAPRAALEVLTERIKTWLFEDRCTSVTWSGTREIEGDKEEVVRAVDRWLAEEVDDKSEQAIMGLYWQGLTWPEVAEKMNEGWEGYWTAEQCSTRASRLRRKIDTKIKINGQKVKLIVEDEDLRNLGFK